MQYGSCPLFPVTIAVTAGPSFATAGVIIVLYWCEMCLKTSLVYVDTPADPVCLTVLHRCFLHMYCPDGSMLLCCCCQQLV